MLDDTNPILTTSRPPAGLVNAPEPVDSFSLVLTIVAAADERKGADIVVLDVVEVSYLADYFVIVTGFSSAQLRAIARSITERVEATWQRLPRNVEGQAEGGWILQDYGDVVTHLFLPQQRAFYDIESFWGHAKRVPLPNVDLASPQPASLS
ncbi:ribosome silencing factor [Trichothermofontia sichuanensis B231]|uniref:ribosome silencing factor n=1 Tax=Trichothermofontia sichuanensis TaxID=3045816 RepID=UPI00224508D8|nr:ribosome silencing factor [Trichothermofontia sichuanensis]UZQ55215.1 ribosome silencing factor [Trichothermofontia sichuanensis B231]